MSRIEIREASVDGAPLMARWARISDLPVWSAAKLAFIADTATMGIAQTFQPPRAAPHADAATAWTTRCGSGHRPTTSGCWW